MCRRAHTSTRFRSAEETPAPHTNQPTSWDFDDMGLGYYWVTGSVGMVSGLR